MLCYSRPSYVTSDSKYPGAGILTALKNNLDKKIIQFQYIGTKSGLYINYPATKLTDCETYDPRFRFDNFFLHRNVLDKYRWDDVIFCPLQTILCIKYSLHSPGCGGGARNVRLHEGG